MNPTRRRERERHHDRGPHREAPLRREQAHQQPGRAGHHAGGEVELAADHQQRDRDRHDPERRGDVGPVGDAAERAERVRRDPEERADDQRAEQRAELRAPQQARPSRPMFARRSSATGTAGAAPRRGGVGGRRSSRAGLRELLDRRGVVLGDEAGAGEHGLAAADRVRVASCRASGTPPAGSPAGTAAGRPRTRSRRPGSPSRRRPTGRTCAASRPSSRPGSRRARRSRCPG